TSSVNASIAQPTASNAAFGLAAAGSEERLGMMLALQAFQTRRGRRLWATGAFGAYRRRRSAVQ
ncbi:MAG TPA: hypothetical protein VHC19_03095, partial [Pirellulales bacterium]|nr:hypothetical protein [Pirellulales bacterium]